jgi:signal transduction histidine kinase
MITGDIALLLIDDDENFLDLSRAYLEENGIRDITAVRSANEALGILATRSFDAIIADYELPPGMNSLALLKILKSQGNETPFIIFTGRSREEVAIEALNSGAAYYLQKEMDLRLLFAELTNMIFRLAETRQAREQVALRERELREKNEELESFAYSISHDLRAPLRVIDGYCSAIQRRGGSDLAPEVRNYIERIQASSAKMNEMIESLLKFSRAGRLALTCENLDLSKIGEEIVASLKKQHPDRQVTVTIAPAMVANGDRTLVSMALQNLLDNAWKYTGNRDDAMIAFGMADSGTGPVFAIRDNGAGFDAANAENLFRPFIRFHTESEFPGTGIGLATVSRIIGRHGGRIWAESEAGKGAVFFFTLPGCRSTPGNAGATTDSGKYS